MRQSFSEYRDHNDGPELVARIVPTSSPARIAGCR